MNEHHFICFFQNFRRSTADGENVNDADHALKEIAAEEIDEVDIIMEDISDEIADLQQSITNSSLRSNGGHLGNGAPCFINKKQINCNERFVK